MSRDELGFVTFCIGSLARKLELSRNDVYERLNRSGILYEYIVPCFDVHHTFSSEHIVEDLCQLMKKRGVL